MLGPGVAVSTRPARLCSSSPAVISLKVANRSLCRLLSTRRRPHALGSRATRSGRVVEVELRIRNDDADQVALAGDARPSLINERAGAGHRSSTLSSCSPALSGGGRPRRIRQSVRAAPCLRGAVPHPRTTAYQLDVVGDAARRPATARTPGPNPAGWSGARHRYRREVSPANGSGGGVLFRGGPSN
jgi:hypothetical protein